MVVDRRDVLHRGLRRRVNRAFSQSIPGNDGLGGLGANDGWRDAAKGDSHVAAWGEPDRRADEADIDGTALADLVPAGPPVGGNPDGRDQLIREERRLA